MRYRELGNTGLEVSEVGFGGEWLAMPGADDTRALLDRAHAAGVNVLDVWMSNPRVRSQIGDALAASGTRAGWVIQGHIGSTWSASELDPATYRGPRDGLEEARREGGQYVRTRDVAAVRAAFEDMLARFHTDYIDLGMIHFVDDPEEFERLMAGGPYLDYIHELKAAGAVRHVGLSTHNPQVGKLAALSGEVESVMFSVNPAFDMLPASKDIEVLFGTQAYEAAPGGIDPVRADLYATCERAGVGITVMKPFAGGRLFSAVDSPFGVALTPVQCLHYCLTRPAVASVLGGYRTLAELDAALAYEGASVAERDYAGVLASAPRHAYLGQCTYCGHCAPCPAGIDVAAVNKFADLARAAGAVAPTLAAHYAALGATASACVGCRACERRCPFGVPAAERMARAAELFGR